MTHQIQSISQPRLAGALYLGIAIFGGFSIGYVPQVIIAAGDAAATTANLSANLSLHKSGIFADIIVILFELVLTAILYVLFRDASPTLCIIALISRAGMITVMGINLLLWVMPLALINSGLAGHEALIVLFFDIHTLGVFVWQLFFGLHLLALGWTIIRTDLVPHFLGWGLFVGAFGYLFQGIVELIIVDVPAIDLFAGGLLVIVTISELSFGVWLLIWGPKRL
ncbi:MAG: DUF4386 domain-containing protein [Rhodobacteraceae bacterium]|nr:DUF4386 domain-containing protein [Paracoccaceae bacterium]